MKKLTRLWTATGIPAMTLGVTAVALGVLAAASIGTYFAVQTLSGASHAVAHTREVRENLNALTSRLSDAESSRADWVRSGRPADLAGFRAAVSGIEETLEVIEHLVGDNAAQLSRLEQVEILVHARLSDGAAEPGARTEAGIRALQAQLRGLVLQMHAEEDRLLDRRLADFDAARRVSTASTAALGVLCALLLVGLQYRAWRHSRRLLRLNASLARNERALREALDRQQTLAAERRKVEEALRIADRRKDEYLAMLSHELRNPLAPIRNATELLRRRHSEDPLVSHVAGVLERQVVHMVRLVEDLLDVSRFTLGTLKLRIERVEAADVVRDALEASQPVIESLRHSISVHLPEQPAPVEADPTRLTQVVTNLLNNAAKYTPPGGRIELRVEVHAARDGREVRIAVRDNGMGIPSDKLGGVFEMFNRLGRADELGRGGLGVGLALSRAIVRMHEGSIDAHSDGPGLGSEFVVTLPAAPLATVHSLAARRDPEGTRAQAVRGA
jgi:signal transduction histidine kinase